LNSSEAGPASGVNEYAPLIDTEGIPYECRAGNDGKRRILERGVDVHNPVSTIDVAAAVKDAATH
jgi:hypothetical protein